MFVKTGDKVRVIAGKDKEKKAQSLRLLLEKIASLSKA